MKLFKTLTMVCALAALSACGGGDSGASGSAPAATATAPQAGDKIYSVALDASYAPFEYQDNSAMIVGFSTDLIKAIAEDQGLKFAFYNVDFAHIFGHLDSGEADLIAASISITPERQAKMAFSDSYFTSRPLMLVKKENTTINRLTDAATGVRVGAPEGTLLETRMRELLGEANASNLTVSLNVDTLFKDLKEGKLDMVIADNGVVEYFVAQNSADGYRTVVDESFAPENFAFATQKTRSDDLLQKVNAGLKNLRSNGKYEELYKKWFNKASQ